MGELPDDAAIRDAVHYLKGTQAILHLDPWDGRYHANIEIDRYDEVAASRRQLRIEPEGRTARAAQPGISGQVRDGGEATMVDPVLIEYLGGSGTDDRGDGNSLKEHPIPRPVRSCGAASFSRPLPASFFGDLTAFED
ncbi:MAG TPA: hypothetical protein VE914_17475 [Candidatus Angelobacter sp.]|nr:hypothetical protein [Candidatus Angelobacter sp.]